MAGQFQTLNPDAAGARKKMTTLDYSPLNEWVNTSFQKTWLSTLTGPRGHIFSSAGRSPLASSYSDTTSTDTLLDFGLRTTQNLSSALAFAQSLYSRAQEITNWVDDQEYDSQFAEIVEPISEQWLETIGRFKSGPEIEVSWDEDE